MQKILILLMGILLSFNILAAANLKTLKFATEATYPPFESIDASGKIVGFDVDVMNALCKEMGATCVISNQAFDSLIPSLKIGKYDALIASLGITEERKKVVDFTDSYYDNTVTFVAAKNSKLEISKVGLQNKAIAVQSGTTFEHYALAEYGDVAHVKNYASYDEAFIDLKAGRVDTVFGDLPVVLIWLKQKGNENFQVIGKPFNDQKYFGLGCGIAVQKGNAELLNSLNTALAKIKADKTLDKLTKQYFGLN